MVFKKIWKFLWKSESILSWIVDIIIIFLLVKFLILPGIGLALGTSLPLVIVESGSMEHSAITYCLEISTSGNCLEWSSDYMLCEKHFSEKGFKNFDNYWESCGNWYTIKNITKEEMFNWGFNKGLYKGDIIVVKGKKNKDYSVGDIVVFRVPGYSTPIIHRIIDIRYENGVKIFSTKGDHNNGQNPYENYVVENQVLGNAIARVPKLGWLKLFFVGIFK